MITVFTGFFKPFHFHLYFSKIFISEKAAHETYYNNGGAGVVITNSSTSQDKIVGVSRHLVSKVISTLKEENPHPIIVGKKKKLVPVSHELVWYHVQFDLVDFQAIPAHYGNSIMHFVLVVIDVNSRLMKLVKHFCLTSSLSQSP